MRREVTPCIPVQSRVVIRKASPVSKPASKQAFNYPLWVRIAGFFNAASY